MTLSTDVDDQIFGDNRVEAANKRDLLVDACSRMPQVAEMAQYGHGQHRMIYPCGVFEAVPGMLSSYQARDVTSAT